MKKLMMGAVALLTALSVNAAVVNWKSGNLQRAEDAKGGWSSSLSMAGTSFDSYFYTVAAEDWSTVSAMSQEELYSTYISQAATLSKTASKLGYSTLKTDPASIGETYYGVLIYTYKDEDLDNAEFYLATTASKYVEAENTYSVTEIGSTVGASEGWQAVPEPFSGSLALLGVGLVALRRKMKKQKKA